MKLKVYLILLITSIVMIGCPYEAEVELNTYEESIRIDKKLLGIWIAFHDDGSREEMLLTKAAASVFDVIHKQYEPNNKLSGRFNYRAYPTEISDYVIFNIETQDGKYLFAKYGWTGKNTFYLQAVNKDFVNENFKVDSVTTENLRDFITQHVNNEKLYDDKLEFYRKDSPEHERVKTFMRKSGF
ncbi:MAG: hypothetical protein J5I47_02810 [Vicingus serpentipes]|nr:hypothetical protein [Vicingus serpentipes]